MYYDKPIEELEPILQNYLEGFKKRTGLDPDPEEIARKIRSLALQNEEKAFTAVFGTMSATSLQTVARVLEELHANPNREQEQEPEQVSEREVSAPTLTTHEVEKRQAKKDRKNRGQHYSD